LKNPVKIILTTSDKNHALEALEHTCVVDYLVKQISKELFNKSIEKLETLLIKAANNSLETQNLKNIFILKWIKDSLKLISIVFI